MADKTKETENIVSDTVENDAVQEIAQETGPKMIKIKLFKDNGEYKDDVFVSVNGMRYQIQRGVEVEVPDFVKEVLDNSAAQDSRTAELIAQAVEDAKMPM